MAYENIIFEKEENIAVITFNRPEAMNALNNQTRAEFRSAIDEVAADRYRSASRAAGASASRGVRTRGLGHIVAAG